MHEGTPPVERELGDEPGEEPKDRFVSDLEAVTRFLSCEENLRKVRELQPIERRECILFFVTRYDSSNLNLGCNLPVLYRQAVLSKGKTFFDFVSKQGKKNSPIIVNGQKNPNIMCDLTLPCLKALEWFIKLDKVYDAFIQNEAHIKEQFRIDAFERHVKYKKNKLEATNKKPRHS